MTVPVLPENVYHRSPCCTCARCGGNECYAVNPEDDPREFHFCARCDAWIIPTSGGRMSYITQTGRLARAVIKAHADGELWATVIPVGTSPKARRETLDSIQNVVTYLRQEGHDPEVIVRHLPAGEVHAVGLKDKVP